MLMNLEVDHTFDGIDANGFRLIALAVTTADHRRFHLVCGKACYTITLCHPLELDLNSHHSYRYVRTLRDAVTAGVESMWSTWMAL